MYNSKLGKLYRSLDKSELRQLRQWVHSPMHNQHSGVIQLFEYLLSRRIVSELTYRKERVYEYVYPTQLYDDLGMRHLMSLAYDCLKSFVRYNLLVQENITGDIQLAKDLRRRKLDKLAGQTMAAAEEGLSKTATQSAGYYLDHFRLEAEQLQQRGTQERIGSNNLEAISNSLSKFFIINTLHYACVHLSHRNLRQTDCKIVLLEAVLREVEQGSDYTQSAAVMAYYHTYMALRYPEQEAHFQQLKYYILTQSTTFTEEEHKNLFLQALNYCIRRLNVGNEHYIREAFELYRYGLREAILLESGQISAFSYKNAVALGIRLGELDWVAAFIPQYAPYLEAQQRETYVHYNSARLHFARGDYKTAMQLLAGLEYDDVFMDMDSKVLLLKMYYEQGAYDALESLLQSFYTAVQRRKILSYHRDHYKHTILFIKRLLAIPPSDDAAKRQLMTQIQQTEPLAERPWLLQCVERRLAERK